MALRHLSDDELLDVKARAVFAAEELCDALTLRHTHGGDCPRCVQRAITGGLLKQLTAEIAIACDGDDVDAAVLLAKFSTDVQEACERFRQIKRDFEARRAVGPAVH